MLSRPPGPAAVDGLWSMPGSCAETVLGKAVNRQGRNILKRTSGRVDTTHPAGERLFQWSSVCKFCAFYCGIPTFPQAADAWRSSRKSAMEQVPRERFSSMLLGSSNVATRFEKGIEVTTPSPPRQLSTCWLH